MRARLLVSLEAEKQIRAASDWWSENRLAARGLLREELTRAFQLITTQPGVGGRIRDTAFGEIHRLYLFRIRYNLFYRQRDDSVEVLALWHASRGGEPPL